jgi:hypothetical protein
VPALPIVSAAIGLLSAAGRRQPHHDRIVAGRYIGLGLPDLIQGAWSRQQVEDLLQGFEVCESHQDCLRPPVAGNHDALMGIPDLVKDCRQPRLRIRQRIVLMTRILVKSV